MYPYDEDSYDVAEHIRMRNRMVACWVIMLALWAGAWYMSWQAALFSLLANVYFLFSLFWYFKLYPKKSERD